MVKNIRLLVLFSAFSIVFAACLVLIPSNAEAAVDYDKHYYDPFGDIQLVAQEGHFVTGSQWDDLDITEMTSTSETTGIGPTKITFVKLSVTVKGTINEDDNIYGVFISTEKGEYSFAYKDKQTIGFNMEDETTIFAVADVAGSTITFTIEEDQLDEPESEFKWNALAIERTADGNYGDIAPNKLVKITEPWDRSTVFGAITVSGVTRDSLLTYEKVEIQIDGRSGSGWTEATDKGGWAEWEYTLDTAALAESEHIIYVRATDNNGDTHEDDITINVDQGAATSPASTSKEPAPNIGDKYVFGLSETDEPEMINIDISTTSDMETSVTEQDVEVGTYECWKMSTSQAGTLSIGGIELNFETEGDVYLEKDDFDIAKEDSTVKITSAVTAAQEQHKISVYSPAKVHYEFPIEVAKEWDGDTEATIDIDGSVTAEDLEIEYKCLFHSDSTSVPGGNFETFAIRSQNRDASFYKVEYYAPDIGYPVRIETYDIDDLLIGVLVLTGHDIKDTLIDLAEDVEMAVENGGEKVYKGDDVEFELKVKNNGVGKADNAVVIGYVEGVDPKVPIREFNRKILKIKPQEETTATLTWQANESGRYRISFQSFSDNSKMNVNDDSFVYDDITVYKKIVEPDPSFLSLNRTPALVGVAAILLIVIIVMVVLRKKKKPEDVQFVTVESLDDEEYDEDEDEEEEGEAEVAEVIVDHEEEGEKGSRGEGEGEEGEKEYQCPACEVELGGDELECPSCKVVFEEYLAGSGEDATPSIIDELAEETFGSE